MATANGDSNYLVDGSFDFSGGVDSSKVTTIQSDLNPNGLPRNQLSWLNNASVRRIGILQRTGWQPLFKMLDSGRWQGGYIYEPDGANPYLVCSISGRIYRFLLEAPYGGTDLSAVFGLVNPPDPEMAFFVQGENYLVIQAGDFYNNPPLYPAGTLNDYGQALALASNTLPLFWDGTTLRRSRGITTLAPAGILPDINEIPAATVMDYYGNRLWYAGGRNYSAGDMVGGPSGHAANRNRDSILSVTENPLCFSGDGFTVPTNAGNIRAIKHSSNINASLGQGQLYIFTRKSVYSLTVPTTRLDWIGADQNNQPQQTIVQLINGAVGDRCIVPVNGDLFYQSFEPSVRSLLTAVRYFGDGQWGNTPISQNEERALQFNDRALMRFSSGIEFDNRILMAALPVLAADGINVIHQGILPLDFDIVTNLAERKAPVWEGIYDGLQILQLFNGDFGGLPRAFAVNLSDVDGSINIWELTTNSRTENGDNRVTWGAEFPAFNWSTSGYEYKLKQLVSGEFWIDKISSVVDIDVYYRADAEPCWRFWFHDQICSARCEEEEGALVGYPCEPTREGYVWTIVLPEPHAVCNQMQYRPTTQGYQFQVKIVLKGWCRIRGLILYALPKLKPMFAGMPCPPNPAHGGMSVLPNPFQVPITAAPVPIPSAFPSTVPVPGPTPTPEQVPPQKAINPNPANGAIDQDPTATILSWEDGGGATSFDVYLDDVFLINQAGTTLDPGTIAIYTAHTWRIDSVNDAGTTTGDTWSFTTTWHPIVVAWIPRVIANGGADPSIATKQTLSNFCVGLDTFGLTSKMIAVNCFAPDDLIAAITPLIVVGGNDPWTNNNFVGGDITAAGLQGNTTNKYLDTGVNPNTVYASDNDAGFTWYARSTGANTVRMLLICVDGASTHASGIYSDGGAVYLGAYQVWSISSAGTLPVSEYSFYSGNRTAVDAEAIYEANGTTAFHLKASNANAPTARPNFDMYAYCMNRAGAAMNFPVAAQICSFCAVHNGLDATEAENLFNVVQAMRVAFGGGYT